MKLVDQVHHWLGEVVQPGDSVMDGTAGNGHDTLCLARLVGPLGHVHALDIQATAIAATRHALAAARLTGRVTLHQACHSTLATMALPACRVALFNLGYLPGGDHARTTEAATSIAALEGAWTHLFDGGFLSILAYPGHPAGLTERNAVAEWVTHITERDGELLCHEVPSARHRRPPEWFLLQRTRK